jgi:membrane protein EpsK
MAEIKVSVHDTLATERESAVSDGVATSRRSPGASQRFTANLLANVAGFAVSMAIGLFFTPYLIRHLGIAGYGLWPLTMTLMLYMGLVTLGLNSAVGRFLTIAVEQGDKESGNRIFNTSLFGSLALAVGVGAPALLLSSHVEWLVRIPPGSEADARRLFISAVAAFVITTVATPFEVATFCRNRFDLRNAVALSGTVVRIGIVILLFAVTAPGLWQIGLGLVLGSLVSLGGAVYVWRRLVPFLRIRLSSFSRESLKDLTSLGGWSVVNQVGGILYLGTDLLVVNRMLGPDAGGQFAALQQWSSLLRALANAVGSIFGPSLTAHFARGDMEALIAYCRRSTKFIGLTLAVPIGLVSGFSKPLLHVWVGAGLEPLAPLMSLMTISLSITLSITALYWLQISANCIKVPGIVTCAMGIVNLGLAVLFAGPFRWGMFGVALAGALTLIAKDLVFTPLYGARVLKANRTVFLGTIGPMVLATTVFAAICYAASCCVSQWTWARLIPVCFVLSVGFWASAFRLALTSEERAMAVGLLPSFIGERCRAMGIGI